MPFKYPSATDRLLANIVVDGNGCWIWQGSYNNVGRPRISVRVNGQGKWMYVTRYVMLHIHKQVLRKMHVGLHSCNNKCCVNPQHISRGTQSQNVRQCVAEGRHVPYGRMMKRLTQDLTAIAQEH